MPINASFEFAVLRVCAAFVTWDLYSFVKSCAILLSYSAIAIATAKPALAADTVPHEVSVPSLVKYLPVCPDTLGTIAVVEVDGKLFFRTVFTILR
jgi:hypothetical protein